MYVNNRHISDYGAALQYGYTVSGAAVESAYSEANLFLLLKQKIGVKSITVTLSFFGRDNREAYERYSHFCASLLGILELVMPDQAMYRCVLTKIGGEIYVAEGSMDMTFSFIGLKHGPLCEVSGNTVYCMSTLPETPCKLTATVGTTGSNYALGSVTFPAVIAGEVLCVDGLTGRILVDGVPAAQRAEWLKFPYLTPGKNVIACDDPVTAEFYPVYF